MKSLKLSNLDKMQQNEMQQIKGGVGPWIGGHSGLKGSCLCTAWCGSNETDSRSTQGGDAGTSSYHNRHYKR